MPNPAIFLKIDRPEVSVEEFTEAARALLDILASVGSSLGARRDAVRWVIADLRSGSAVLEAVGEPAHAMPDVLLNRILATAGEGMRLIEQDAVRPPHFDDDALRSARRLSETLTATDSGTSVVRIGAVKIQPTKRTAANVDEIIVGKLKSIGTIEGTLETVTHREGYRFFVEDRRTGRRVACHFQRDLLPRVLAAFERRVIVRGVVWSRETGDPTHIDVRDFEVLPVDDDLPRASAVRGILRGLERDAE